MIKTFYNGRTWPCQGSGCFSSFPPLKDQSGTPQIQGCNMSYFPFYVDRHFGILLLPFVKSLNVNSYIPCNVSYVKKVKLINYLDIFSEHIDAVVLSVNGKFIFRCFSKELFFVRFFFGSVNIKIKCPG